MTKNLYRGKPLNSTVPWVYGAYYEHEPPLIAIGEQKEKPKPYIIRTAFADWDMPRQVEHIPIVEKTVGQFTGLMAQESNRGMRDEDLMIFENDILELSTIINGEKKKWKAVVIWDTERLAFFLKGYGLLGNYTLHRMAIIGNMVDSPELLRGSK